MPPRSHTDGRSRYLAGESLGGRFVNSLVDAILDGLRAR
jgi:hypothetical protein